MPKYIGIYYTGLPIMNCDFCDYSSSSKTAMRLHFKKNHNTDFDLENRNFIQMCVGCKKQLKSCICQKM